MPLALRDYQPNIGPTTHKELTMLWTILLIILILALLGAAPAWPHSRNWGYAPSGGLGLVLVIILVLFLMGRLPI